MSQVKQIACAKERGFEIENACRLVWLENSVSEGSQEPVHRQRNLTLNLDEDEPILSSIII